MKKVFLTIIIGASLMSSCKKEGCTDSAATNYDKKAKKDDGSCKFPVQDGFVWKENGGAEIKADSAFWTTGSWGTGIRAYKGGMANFFEINWDNMNNTSVGSKSLPSIYGFTFLKGTSTYSNPNDASLSITSVNGSLISGNCTVSVTGGSITTITATFNNLLKK